MLSNRCRERRLHDGYRAGTTAGPASCCADRSAAARSCRSRWSRGRGHEGTCRCRLAVVRDISEIAAGPSGTVRDSAAAIAVPRIFFSATHRSSVDMPGDSGTEGRACGEVAHPVETCPHYLHLAAETIADGATLRKCAPPIRRRENREALWQGLRDGAIDMVSTDHSPCLPAMKRLEERNFKTAWGGIASLSLALPLMWTEANQRGFTLSDIALWMAGGPHARPDLVCATAG